MFCFTGSPFYVDFVDASQMRASGEGLSLVPNRRQAEFMLHTPAANLTELSVAVTGPDGRSVPAHLRDNGNSTYKVDWVPNAVGECLPFFAAPFQLLPYWTWWLTW